MSITKTPHTTLHRATFDIPAAIKAMAAGEQHTNKLVPALASAIDLNAARFGARVSIVMRDHIHDRHHRLHATVSQDIPKYSRVGAMLFVGQNTSKRISSSMPFPDSIMRYAFELNIPYVGREFPYKWNTISSLLALQLTSRLYMNGHVMDIGAGDGILTIAAIKMGAEKATGVELYPAWGRGINIHAQANGVSERVDAIIEDVRNDNVARHIENTSVDLCIASLGGIGFHDGVRRTPNNLTPENNLHLWLRSHIKSPSYYLLAGIPPEYEHQPVATELKERFGQPPWDIVATIETTVPASLIDDCGHEQVFVSHLFRNSVQVG